MDSLGTAYYKLGKYKEAIEADKEAVRLKPDSAKPHYNLAISYLAVKEKAPAIQEYRTLKQLDPEMAGKLYTLIYK